MPDIYKKCIDCGNEFIWTEKSQEFFKQEKYDEPKRCKFCAKKKKFEREQRIKNPEYQKRSFRINTSVGITNKDLYPGGVVKTNENVQEDTSEDLQ